MDGAERAAAGRLAQDLHQHPRRIAARSAPQASVSSGVYHARSMRTRSRYRALELPIRSTRKWTCCAARARSRQQFFQARPSRLRLDQGSKTSGAVRRNLNGRRSASGSTKKSNGSMTSMSAVRSTGDGEFAGSSGENVARRANCMRVLPGSTKCCAGVTASGSLAIRVGDVRAGRDRRGLRSQPDRPLVAVTGGVVEPDKDRHAATRHARVCPESRPASMRFPGRRQLAVPVQRRRTRWIMPAPQRSASRNPGWLSGRQTLNLGSKTCGLLPPRYPIRG